MREAWKRPRYFVLLLMVLLPFNQGCDPKPANTTTQQNASKDIVDAPHKDEGQQPDSDDLKLLQGDWIIVDAQRDGVPYPAEIGGTTTFAGHRVTAKTTDGVVATYDIKIDPSKDPKTIDWTLQQGDERQTLFGLYRIEGDTLINCSPPRFEMPRPTELQTKHGDERWLFTLNRVKAEKSQ